MITDLPKLQSTQAMSAREDEYHDFNSPHTHSQAVDIPLQYYTVETERHDQCAPQEPWNGHQQRPWPLDPSIQYTEAYNIQPSGGCHNQMDIDILSAENYQNIAYARDSLEYAHDSNISYGDLLADSNISQMTKSPDLLSNMRALRSLRKEVSRSGSTDEAAPANGPTKGQRGRPRLDTRDLTSAEVSGFHLLLFPRTCSFGPVFSRPRSAFHSFY